jgi:uncharacterized repeat protein (TIGR03803 family)
MLRFLSFLSILAVVLASGAIGLIDRAHADPVTILHVFTGSPNDGAEPVAGLIEDAEGNLYGTTTAGGTECVSDGGCGTVFKLAPDGTQTLLYSFCAQANCADGFAPESGLVQDGAGNLYGTTSVGGANDWGIVYKITPGSAETVLYSFCSLANCTDGAWPQSGLSIDQSGNLYGTTLYGGAATGPYCGCGTAFKITPDGAETVLYSFCSESNCTDGAFPMANVILDDNGNIYGTTSSGGSGTGSNCNAPGCGTIFKIPAGGGESVLHSFCIQDDCPDGREPQATMVLDPYGNLYGTALGGTGKDCEPQRCGVVFKLAPDGTETVVHSFCNKPSCSDGANPYNADVIMDAKGNLYGTTVYGGNRHINRDGTMFRVAPGGGAHRLATFDKLRSGLDPMGGLVSDPSGNLYGITQIGGDKKCNAPYGCGVVFMQKE